MHGPESHSFEKSCFDVLRSFGKSISQIALYNKPEHPSVQTILQEITEKLGVLLAKDPSLVYVMMGDQVLVNGKLIGPYSQVPPNVAAFFMRNKLQSLSFKGGVTVDDIGVLCASAAARPGSGAKSPVQLLVDKNIRSIALNEAEIAVMNKGQKPGGGGATDTVGAGIGHGHGAGGGGGSGPGSAASPNATFVRTQFGRYMSPELVEKLAAAPQSLQLGGESRILTVLFADIRGFTGIAEGMNPQQTTKFINSFLTPMTRIILDHDGFIDKYMGDSIMAFWNAPLADDKHAEKAGAAALAMKEKLAVLNQAWRDEHLARKTETEFKPVRIGIGLNTGLCCVGNIGSEQRFEYSAVGDAVNLASRLEGQSAVYGFDIVIGEETRAKNPEAAALELDLLRVKGKSVPERLFGLLGDEELAKSEAFSRLLTLHASFLTEYRSQQWDDAERLLGACLATGFPLAGYCDLYRARIALHRRHPPAPDWDGSFTAERK